MSVQYCIVVMKYSQVKYCGKFIKTGSLYTCTLSSVVPLSRKSILFIYGQTVADTEKVKKADPPKTMKNI